METSLLNKMTGLSVAKIDWNSIQKMNTCSPVMVKNTESKDIFHEADQTKGNQTYVAGTV